MDINFDDLVPPKDNKVDFSDLIPKVAATPAPKKGVLDRISDAVDEGKANFSREVKSPLKAAGSLAYGAAKGAKDMLDGGAQLLSRGVNQAVQAISPKSAAAKYMQDQVQSVDADIAKSETQYQADTKDSVFAGTGRVAGNALVPLGTVNKAARAGSLMAKARAGVGIGATAGALQPVVVDPEDPNIDYAKQKAIQVGAGAVLGGATPIATRGALEIASKLGVKPATNSLVKTRMAQLFDNSPTPREDARVIQDINGIKEDPLRYNQLTSAQAVTKAGDARGNGTDYINQVKDALKAAGIKDSNLSYVINKKNPTSAEIDGLRGSTQGDAVADALTLSARNGALTKEVPSNGISTAARKVIDLVAPTWLSSPLKAVVGGRQTREAAIDNLTSTRNLQAADRFASENGGAALDTSLGALRDSGAAVQAGRVAAKQAKVDLKASNTLTAQADKKTALQNAFDNSSDIAKTIASTRKFTDDAALDVRMDRVAPNTDLGELTGMNNTQRVAKTPIAGTVNKAEGDTQSAIDKAFATQVAEPKFNLMDYVTVNTEVADKAKADKVIAGQAKADLKASTKQQAKDVKTAERKAAQVIEDRQAAALSGNAGDVGGGSLHATASRFKDELGISQKDSKKLIQDYMDSSTDQDIKDIGQRLLDNKPHKLMLKYQDNVLDFAKSKGMESKGALSQSTETGALSTGKTDVQDVVKYAHGVTGRRQVYTQGSADIKGSDLPPDVKASALAVIGDLQTTSGSADRATKIQALYAKHPDKKTALSAVFNRFK